MNYRALGSVAGAAAVAFAQPVVYIAQEANKAVQIIAAARKAIGDKKLDALKTFSVQGSLQRNVNTSQVTSDIEIVLELPDKYLRSETPSGSSGMMMGPSLGATGFDGDRPLQKITNMMTSEATSPADLEKQMQELQKQAPVLADYAMYFEDWRDVDGIKFPFRMRRSMAGTTTEEGTVNKVKVNPKVDPKRFAGDG